MAAKAAVGGGWFTFCIGNLWDICCAARFCRVGRIICGSRQENAVRRHARLNTERNRKRNQSKRRTGAPARGPARCRGRGENVPRTPASLCAAEAAASFCSALSEPAARACTAASITATRSRISGRKRAHKRSSAAVRFGLCRFFVGLIHGKSERIQLQPSTAEICAESVSGSKGLKRTASTPRSAKRRWSVLCTLAVSSSTGMLRGGGILAQLAEGGGAVHAGHHHVEQDGVGLVLGGASQALRAGAGHDHFPAGNAFQAERGYFADVVFVVDDQNLARHGGGPSGTILNRRGWLCRWRPVRRAVYEFGTEDCREGSSSICRERRSMVSTSASSCCGWTRALARKCVGPRVSWRRSSWRKVAAGVDHQRQAGEVFVLAQPVDHVEAVAVGQADVEHQQVRLEGEAGVERPPAGCGPVAPRCCRGRRPRR